jgi:hypothetical protein
MLCVDAGLGSHRPNEHHSRLPSRRYPVNQKYKSRAMQAKRIRYAFAPHTCQYLVQCCCSGKGTFFKHVDIPRSEKMFGSLVVVFPTFHEGGALLLRHRGDGRIIDSGQALAGAANDRPSIGYMAFFSQVEHEVAPVTSGYRVTLTYNLYFDDGGPSPRKTPSRSISFPHDYRIKKGSVKPSKRSLRTQNLWQMVARSHLG